MYNCLVWVSFASETWFAPRQSFWLCCKCHREHSERRISANSSDRQCHPLEKWASTMEGLTRHCESEAPNICGTYWGHSTAKRRWDIWSDCQKGFGGVPLDRSIIGHTNIVFQYWNQWLLAVFHHSRSSTSFFFYLINLIITKKIKKFIINKKEGFNFYHH